MKIKILGLLMMFAGIAHAGPYHQAIDYIFPLPNSELLPVKTTVILKLDETYNDLITNLADLIVVTDEGSVCSGTTFFAADDRTIIFKPNNNFQKGNTITVTIQLSQFGFDDFQTNFTIAKSSGNDLDWVKTTTLATSSSTRDVQDVSSVRLINGVAVPSDFPEIQVILLGETAPGRIFIPATDWLIICENDGTPYFYRKYDDGYTKMRFDAHPSGDLSFHSYEVYDTILDHHFEEIDTVSPGHGYLQDDHELQILENGHMLLVARDRVRIDMSEIVSGGNSNALVEAHHVQELDQDHNVIFEWRNWDHLDICETEISLQSSYIDYVHTNSIAVDYDEHLILSPREYNMVMKIDRITGETIWKLGGKNSDFTFINEDIEFSRLHDVRPVPGEPNHYTLYDNGRARANGTQFSRAVEYKLDLEAMTAEKVWEYRHTPDLYSAYCGSCQPLANGNRLIGWAENDFFTEVDANEERVYEMSVEGFSCSRCRRYEWDGMMLYPALTLENMGSIVRLIFNKFGDPNVEYYNVYVGESDDSLALFDATGQTYCDIDASLLVDGVQYVFGVTAVNTDGEESDFSPLETTRISAISAGENAVTNGDFQSTDGWDLETTDSAVATGQVNTEGMYQIDISQGGTSFQSVQLTQDNLIVKQDKDYVFSFDAYATSNRIINVTIESTDFAQTDYGKIGYIAISSQLQHYEYDFTMNDATDSESRVVFNCGTQAGDVFVDNVSLVYSDMDPLSDPWQSLDIGQPSVAGEAGMRDDRFVIRGSGSDIWDESDAFHYVYREVTGDAEIIARVYSLEESNSWSKAGVMMRNSLEPESRHAMMVMSARNGAAFQRRVADGGSSTHTAGTQTSAPHWVRLVREDNLLTGYESSDGEDWDLVDVEVIDMEDTIYIGLPVTSHDDDVLCEAQLDHVEVSSE